MTSSNMRNLRNEAENGSNLAYRLKLTRKTRFWGQKAFMTSSSWHNDVIKYLIFLKIAQNGSNLVYRLNMTQETRFWGLKLFMTSLSYHYDVIKYEKCAKKAESGFSDLVLSHDFNYHIHCLSSGHHDVTWVPWWRHNCPKLSKSAGNSFFYLILLICTIKAVLRGKSNSVTAT